jgi:DNA-binding response OmpR family regulator
MIRILVVDDEIGIRELLREILEDSGYQVTTASTAAQADMHWAQERPDLVLLDYSLPDRDGLSLVRSWELTTRRAGPVIMLSGYATIERPWRRRSSARKTFWKSPYICKSFWLWSDAP